MNKKTQQLGMPIGTASNKLIKHLLLHLAIKCNMHQCYRCGEIITTSNNISIDHKINWLDSEQPIEIFFDVNNIAFSHKKCNIMSRRFRSPAILASAQKARDKMSIRPKLPPNKNWCWGCKKILSSTFFTKNKRRYGGLSDECKNCKKQRRKTGQ